MVYLISIKYKWLLSVDLAFCESYTCSSIYIYIYIYIYISRAREIDKCKSVQPFHKQSAISVSFTETTDRPFPRSRKLPIGCFRNDRPCPNVY